MNKVKNPKNLLLKFILLTYLIFWVLFAITGAVIMLNAPKPFQSIMPIICAWSPTFAFLLIFKKLYTDLQLKEFIKQQFNTRVKVLLPIVMNQGL